ncbi:MAG: ABC transporter permease [Alphaproteobacteria bacterium]|nr:ABC transporter permease [Alphaproteobacteria bacterium]
MSRTGKLWRDPSILIVPAIGLLVVGFVVPLVLFLADTLREMGSLAEIADEALAIVASREVVDAMITTNWIALLVTLLTLVAGYPIAYYLANCERLRFTLVLFCIIVPYFTSVIVRTYSWMVLLGRNGIINQFLLGAGLADQPVALLYNKLGIVIGMTYVLLPYMIMTLYAAMKTIDPGFMRAARALGASRTFAFLRVYLPLSAHGVLSGALIVFILAIGFFITPALMGGPKDVVIAMLIERQVELMLDWPNAAILSLLLLAVTLALYAVYYRVTDVRRMMGA